MYCHLFLYYSNKRYSHNNKNGFSTLCITEWKNRKSYYISLATLTVTVTWTNNLPQQPLSLIFLVIEIKVIFLLLHLSCSHGNTHIRFLIQVRFIPPESCWSIHRVCSSSWLHAVPKTKIQYITRLNMLIYFISYKKVTLWISALFNQEYVNFVLVLWSFKSVLKRCLFMIYSLS